jgi:trk system potassium uptake protein TrkA
VKAIIVGAGQVGFHIASHLAREDKEVVVIDVSSDALNRLSDSVDAQVVQGSGSSPTVLEEAGLKKAEILLALTNSDEVNLVACLLADSIAPNTLKVARVRGGDFDGYHKQFKYHSPHIDTLINPEIELVKAIQHLMSIPGATDVGEFANGRIKLVGVTLNLETPFNGVRLDNLSQHIDVRPPLIAAIIRSEKLIIPHGDDQLMAGDLVYFIAEKHSLERSLTIFNKNVPPVRRAMLVGGGRVGYRLAAALEPSGIHTKVVEQNPDRCRFLAERLNRAVVLSGDGSDQSLLVQESVSDMDVVVSVTNDEETNILVSLLAKRMGARKAITKISKFSYFPLMAAIGLEQVVSLRLSAINTILQHIRRGKVLSAQTIRGEMAEVLEAVALETSDIVGKPLKNVNFPKGALVVSIIRGEHVSIPTGDSIIEPNDTIILFAHRQAIPKIEKILTVRLEYV